MAKGVYQRTEEHIKKILNNPQTFKKGHIPWDKGLPYGSGPTYGKRTAERKIVRCGYCNKDIERLPSLLKDRKFIYCDKYCLGKHKSLIFSGENNPFKGKHHTEETRNKLKLAKLGSKLSEDVKNKIRDWYKENKHPMLGKKLNQVARERMSQRMIGHKPPKSAFKKGHISWARGKKGIHLSPNSEFKIGNKPWHTKLSVDDEKRQDYINKIRLNITRDRKAGKFSIKPSKPEQELAKLFQQHNLPFKYVGNYKFFIDSFNPDFVWEEGKKIIEFDGKYWHNLPGQINKDERRNFVYLDAGYDVMLIDEDNLRDENKLIEDIKEFGRDL